MTHPKKSMKKEDDRSTGRGNRGVWFACWVTNQHPPCLSRIFHICRAVVRNWWGIPGHRDTRNGGTPMTSETSVPRYTKPILSHPCWDRSSMNDSQRSMALPKHLAPCSKPLKSDGTVDWKVRSYSHRGSWILLKNRGVGSGAGHCVVDPGYPSTKRVIQRM